MRFVRKLLVVAAMAAATMAFGASSATAVEISESSTGTHCNAVTLMSSHVIEGGCRVRAVSEVETLFQVFVPPHGWLTISTCEDQFEAAIAEDGTGYLYSAILGEHSGNPCTRTQCDEGNGAKIPWPFRLTSTTNMEITFCLRSKIDPSGTAGTPCHTNIAVTPNNGTGAHELRANGTTSGSCENLMGTVRVIGHWNVVPSSSHPAIVILP